MPIKFDYWIALLPFYTICITKGDDQIWFFSEMVPLTDKTKLSTDVKTSSNVPGSKILGPAIGAGAMLLFLVLALVVVKVCQQTITYYVQALLSTIILAKHVLVKEFNHINDNFW